MKTDYRDIAFAGDGRLKLLIIVGTRPEVIRLSAVIDRCRRYFDCILAHTDQNYAYGLSGVFFEELQIAAPEVHMQAAGETLGETLGNILRCSYALMSTIRPDALLVLGDTNSCLSALAAKRLHIPIFHMEAGNRCKDECLPEESNRRVVDTLADVNLAYSENARRYLLESGFPAERVFVVGSPMAEVLHAHLPQITACDILQQLHLTAGKYILLSAHREENLEDARNFRSLFEAVNALAETYDMPILYSCHPRAEKRLLDSGFTLDRRIIRHEPLGFYAYNCLQMQAFAVVSDSGTLPEEAAFFAAHGHAFPAVSVRTSTERPEALEKGCFILGGIDALSLRQAVGTAVAMCRDGAVGSAVPAYTAENVSERVVKCIQSYTPVVNRTVWHTS